MKFTRLATLLTAALPLSLLGGCADYQQSGDGSAGTSSYQWSSLYRQDIRTISVPIFTNIDFARGDEFALTKAVISQIEQRTPYKVVDREKADTILEGQITKVKLQNLSAERGSNLPQEQLYSIRVNFTWKDLRTGRVLVERRGFDQSAAYYPTLGEGRETAALNTTEQLGLAIVQELQADW
ncbi:MAG: hypothetical protein JWM57_4098 [Phycisphaerales bacterium]|nr:hypothetical protein [Phycisphaerales bacterium]